MEVDNLYQLEPGARVVNRMEGQPDLHGCVAGVVSHRSGRVHVLVRMDLDGEVWSWAPESIEQEYRT